MKKTISCAKKIRLPTKYSLSRTVLWKSAAHTPEKSNSSLLLSVLVAVQLSITDPPWSVTMLTLISDASQLSPASRLHPKDCIKSLKRNRI